jgi:hypothetical protein
MGTPGHRLSKNFLVIHQLHIDLWTGFLCKIWR